MNKLLLTILIFGALSCEIAGQTIYDQSATQLESQLSSLQKRQAESRTELDSLEIIYADQTRRIDLEKKRQKPDAGKITKLMSEAFTISDQLETKKKEISVIENSIQSVREKLNGIYSNQIDSLQRQVDSKKFQGDKEVLQTRILRLSEKRLLVSPLTKRLSFDPQKILQIHPDQYADSLEAAIYSDYLSNALAEIDAQLKTVGKTLFEYKEIIKLQEKTGNFLEEVAEQQNDEIYIVTENQNRLENQANYRDPTGTEIGNLSDRSATIQAQLQTYLTILHQLNHNDKIQAQSSLYSSADSGADRLTLKDYLQLLNDVEKELTSYKKIIQNKLKQQ